MHTAVLDLWKGFWLCAIYIVYSEIVGNSWYRLLFFELDLWFTTDHRHWCCLVLNPTFYSWHLEFLQCLVLSSLLFLICFNDLPIHVDQCVSFLPLCTHSFPVWLYRCVLRSRHDNWWENLLTQSGVTNMWAKAWWRSFTTKEYKIISFVTPKHQSLKFVMDNVVLEDTDHCNYLGFILQYSQTWNFQTTQQANLQHRMIAIGMIKRVGLIAYNPPVLPSLHYASCAWDFFTT